MDSLCKDQSNPEIDSLSNAILSQLLVEMGGLERNNANVILLGATNLPMQMDRAMITRFEKRVHIPLPDTGAREAIVKIHLQNTQNELKEEDFEELARLTDGAPGRDIKELVGMALHKLLEQCMGLRQY